MKRVFIAILLSVLLIACASEKEKYFDRYTKFASYVLQNSETFTSMDWEAVVVQYEELRNEYRYHASEMTLEERQQIADLNAKINAQIIEQTAKDAVDTFQGIVDEVIGTLNELTK